MAMNVIAPQQVRLAQPCSLSSPTMHAAQAKGFNHEELEQRVARLEAALAERQK